jgi:thioredoxin 1
MIELTTEDFKEFYDFNTNKFKNKFPIVIDFYAEWCSPCVVVSKVLSDLSKKYQNIKFYKVDCDSEYEMVKLFTIKNLPTIIFLSEDGTYKQVSGSIHTSKIEQMISEMITVKKTVIA